MFVSIIGRLLHTADDGAPGSGTPLATEEETFDKDRAMATIVKLRAFEKDAKAQLKELADLKAQQAEQARKAAEASGEWRTLAETAQAERDALTAQHTTATAELDALKAEIEAEIKPRLKALPEELRDLVPADGTPAQRLAAVRKLEAAASKLAGQTSVARGTLPGPRGGQATAATAADADILAQKRARVGGL